MSKYEWDILKIKNAVKDSVNFTEVLEKIGVPRQGNNSKTLKNILNKYNIDYSHFTGRARSYATTYVEASEYLNSDKKIKTSKLKEKILKENLIEFKCAICGITNWLNKPIVLQLHHIDGNPNHNSLDNLQLLCPNCHSQTSNYCGNANSISRTSFKYEPIKYYCKDCGKEITKGAVYCTMCSRKHTRKVEERPSPQQLLNDYKELKSFVQIGYKYGVSDNAIRKWFKAYDLPSSVKELKTLINDTK